MSDRAALLAEADRSFTDLQRAIDGLTPEEMGRVWLGTWGVREILIHISGWHDVMIPALDRVARGEAPYPPGTYDDFDAWNARFVDEKAGAKAPAIVAELDASYRRLVRAAATVAETHFSTGGAARDLFDGTGPAHYREHTDQIRSWRAAGSTR